MKAIELQAVRRTADSVIELELAGRHYLRHLEFQSRDDPELPLRCLEYDALLLRQTGLPVVTTILYVVPPGPRSAPVCRVLLGERLVNEWRFEWLKLWELDPAEAVASDQPGLLALVPLMSAADLGLVERACRGIESGAPVSQQPDLLAILHVLAEQRYTEGELQRLIGRERIMQSSIWQEAEAKGREEGRAEGREEGREEGRGEGRLSTERELCLEMVKRYHPDLLSDAAPLIEACVDPARLKRWIVESPELSDDEYRQLLDGRDGA